MSLLTDRGPVERQGLESQSPWWTVHAARYRYALPFTRDCRVLDIACGTGYGLSMVRVEARGVVGVDVDAQAAATARQQIGGGVLVGDGRRLPFRDRSFDVILSFETIEHVYRRDRFISELGRVLSESGCLILSTPNARITKPVDGKPKNPFHVHEYTPEELRDELAREFASVHMMGQVLDTRFRVPPFWDEQEELAARGRRAHVLAWRALAKLPIGLADIFSRTLWGQTLFPSADDYRFDESTIDDAPVLVALCRRSAGAVA